MPALPTRVLAVVALFLAVASPAAAALTKAQQACVVADNASWQGLAATFGKAVNACIKSHNKGTTGDLATCVTASPSLSAKIGKAVDKGVDAYVAKCSGLDGDGQPKLPPVFVGQQDDFGRTGFIQWQRALIGLFGVDYEAAAVTDAENEPMAQCQAAVAKTVTKCSDVRAKSFNGCKRSALAVGKAPFPAGATTPAELATCYGFDPKGAIAKACDAPGDKVRAVLAKCVDKGVDLAVAFPQCGVAGVDPTHDCLDAAANCAVCQAVNGLDGLAVDCDALDDGAHNRSCTAIELLVPAYANPCCGDGPAMWADLAAAASAAHPHLNVILNPASGPGAGPEIDPNYVNTGPVGPLLEVRAAGASIYGYVSTSFATRPIGDAKADIDLYYAPAYWRGAGVQVDGIFLDEMSSDLPDVGYYQELRDYVHAKDANARVIANPGQPATQDTSGGSSGFTVTDYATAADVLVTFEGTAADYATTYVAPAWADALPASHFAHLVHGDATGPDLSLALARTRKAGMIYVTDDVLVPNPWDALPSYFAAERDLLRLP